MSSLNDKWEAAIGQPFQPSVHKDSQFIVGFTLLSIGLILSLIFALNRSFLSVPLLGIPASIAFAFGSVYMICAVGVYSATFVLPNSSNAETTIMFQAVSNSARQLYLLLRCISFAPKAQIQISHEGLRVSVQDPSRILDGLVFLDKALFTSFEFYPTLPFQHGEEVEAPMFQVSLSALLETLQIFGLVEGRDRWASREYSSGVNGSIARGGASAVFDNRVLGVSGLCRLSYKGPGDTFSVVIEENNVTTTCELNTYEAESFEDIPFDRDNLVQKIIMKSSWLHDAISELSSTSPDRLTVSVSPKAPYLSLSANGSLGSATMEFSRDPQLIETFQVSRRTVNNYKFSLIKAASQAMALGTKVSIRCDDQGVLSLQFMIEVEDGNISFVDFRFVPFVLEDGDENANDSASETSSNL